ncbi:iron-containing redox enzyme family protein [Pseudonocardia sp. EV170527-09]|nr:iron-containing redox enzyme family protein [Pseudonocardia sp. EV170527-09]
MREEHMAPHLPSFPVLAGPPPRIRDDRIELILGDTEFTVEHPDPARLMALLGALDGTRDVEQLRSSGGFSGDEVTEILSQLDASGFLDDNINPAARPAIDVLLEIEDELNRGFADQVETTTFWRELTERPKLVPVNVYYGMAIENWHFLYREHLFDSAVLSFPGDHHVRAMLNDFYIEEHRHDDIVLKAFMPLGITPEDMRSSRPLPSTTALVNSLAWWARTDPVFFLATISVLEGGPAQGREGSDSFLDACTEAGLDEDFVGPLREHARINASHGHGSVSRELFDVLPAVTVATEARMRGQCSLFNELYRNFYNEIWRYWSVPERPLLRTVKHDAGKVTK